MDYFTYPLDTKSLLRKKIAIKRELLNSGSGWINKKVAVFGGSTTNEVVDQLELFLLHFGIRAEFYQSEYGLYYEAAMFGNPQLDTFQPDIIYIHTNWRNISVFPAMEDTADDVNAILDAEYNRFMSMWESIKKRYGCLVIQNNFERPDYRLMGNRDIWDYRGRSNFISRLNQKFYEYAQGENTFYINDIDYLAQDYGLSEWADPVYWYMYKYICCVNAIPYLAESIANIIKAVFGKNKKLLALDLDNTLWGGIIGEDGVEGIKIGSEAPQGQAYYEFQKYCKALQRIGVVLAVASKNDEENAFEGLRHPDGLLRKDDFVSIRANWNPKDQNLREIAEELSLGLDSFVFADDSPAERELVKSRIPCIEVPDLDRVESYIKVLDHCAYFEAAVLSSEDLERTRKYRARADALAAQASFESYEEYLASLHMKAVITEYEPLYIQRIAQLTNKTNQFNLTTLRCSEDDIKAMQENPDYICLCGRLIDKFSDNGIVTAISGEICGEELHIKLWLMSCRVLKRGLEDVMMNSLIKVAIEKGLKRVIGYYYPTKKNTMVKNFYHEMGFEFVSEYGQGKTKWTVDAESFVFKDTQIEVHILKP